MERQRRGEFYDPAMLRQYGWLYITMIINLATTMERCLEQKVYKQYNMITMQHDDRSYGTHNYNTKTPSI